MSDHVMMFMFTESERRTQADMLASSEPSNINGGSVLAVPTAEPRDPAVARLVFDLLEKHGASQVEIAKSTKVSKPTISNILNGRGRYGVGRKVAERIGKHFGFRTYTDLQAAALRSFGGGVVYDYRYEGLGVVLEAPEFRARWTEAARAAAREMELDAGDNPPPQWWIEQIDRLEQGIRLARIPVPKLPTRGVNAGSGLDDVPPEWPPKAKKK